MNGPIIIPEDAPPYICADLLNVVALESESDGRFLEELEAQVQSGRITQADASRTIDEFPGSVRDEILGYCRDNCSAGHCAMKGFGVELVGADPSALSEADRAKFSFFTTVDAARACGKMSLGMPIL
jgi:hypothetical protein